MKQTPEIRGASGSAAFYFPIGYDCHAVTADDVSGPNINKLLSHKELVNRLCLSSSSLVELLYSIAKEWVSSEETRHSQLLSKAQSLLATAGLAITVTTTFGSFSLSHGEYFPAGWCFNATLLLYILAILAGLVSMAMALWALLIRKDYRALSESDVFNEHELEQASKLEHETPSSDRQGQEVGSTRTQTGTQPDETESVETQTGMQADQAGATYFKRYIIVALVRIYRAHQTIHSKQSTFILIGQCTLFVFLLILGAIGGVMTYSVYSQRANKSDSTPNAPAPINPQPDPTITPPTPPSPQTKPPPTGIPSGGVPLRKNEH